MRRAVIVGRAAAALEEYAAACAMCTFDEVMVIGEMGVHFPDRIDHWVSFHVEVFDTWAQRRANKGFAPAGCFWGAIYKGKRLGEKTTKSRPLQYVPCIGGSSGFVAVCAALDELHVDRVVLAGVPMTREGAHHGDARPWREADQYWATWVANMDKMRDRVRSMSGRTRDALGAPTAEWLGTEEADHGRADIREGERPGAN